MSILYSFDVLGYEIVDVFTARVYAGNPLAVVFGAAELTGSQMLSIAAEFNLSETAFVLPPTTDEATYRIRIFTPKEELPYAGHPSIGTAVTLARRGDITEGNVVQECGAGLLDLVVEGDFATLTGGTPTVSSTIDPKPLLSAAGLTESDLAGAARMAGTGLEFPYLPVTDDAIDRARSMPRPDVHEVYLFSWNAEQRVARARLFAPGTGITEDPATGSAALGLGAYLVEERHITDDGDTSYLVEQGSQIGRPAHLECVVTVDANTAKSVTVRGQALQIARGELMALP